MENKVISTIKNRVSCRSYSSKRVPLSKIKMIAECGMMAPSARNQQIANILVLKSKKAVEKVRKLSLEVFKHDCFYGANTMIMVYGPKEQRFTVHDCSCILENMFIAASSLKINSCWINQVEELFETANGKKVKKSLGLPDDAMVVGTCILGYSLDPKSLAVKSRKDDFIKII